MIKIVYLVAFVWNGGIGPNGVYSRVMTFSDVLAMEACEAVKPMVIESAKQNFPFKPFYVDCIEVTIPEARI